jgi:hypothetical protein
MSRITGFLSAFAVAALLPAVAFADPAAQMTGLFVQSCVAYVGNPPALRSWAARNHLTPVPDNVRIAFLHNAAGQVFDGSAPEAKLALISADSGLCSVATDKAQPDALTQALETGLQRAGLQYRLVIQRNDPTTPAIHDKEYLATKDGKGWRIQLATVNGGGRAMLTAGPE